MNVPPLRCVALDDEAHALDLLALYCARTEGLELVDRLQDPVAARERLEAGGFDLLFLDIQMPALTGLQLLDLVERPFRIIITSAYPEYALEGYRYRVADYLLKPFSYDRFLRAVALAREPEPGVAAEPARSREAPPSHLLLKGDGKHHYHRLDLADLRGVEGLRNYVAFHTAPGVAPGNRIVTLMTMAEAERQLAGTRFLRVHRSWIVDLDRVERVEGHTLVVDGQRLPVGKTYRRAVYAALGLGGDGG